MINTISIKSEQLQKGYFETGSGKEKILIIGSCRVAPICEYFRAWNDGIGNNRFTIYSIDPVNFIYHPDTNEIIDGQAVINGKETDTVMLDMLKSVDYFIHEFFTNYGLFNTNKDAEKNIYQFGLQPAIDICITNWHDRFILFNDYFALDKEFRDIALWEYETIGRLSDTTQEEIKAKGLKALGGFYDVCKRSDLPEMAIRVRERIKNVRYFHSYNHVSSNFTLSVFELITDKFIHLDCLPQSFWDEIREFDMFGSGSTPLCEYDVESHGFNWGEEIVNFKQYNNIP